MALTFRTFIGDAISPYLPELARLRIAVFRDWPYLYDGDADYEERYLAAYRDNPRAIVVGAFAGQRMVGAATGMPMEDHADDFARPLADAGIAEADVFYCAESVLLPEFRGQGAGHRFFDLREDHARALGRSHSAFCGVLRADDHPARPPEYRPLDPLWRARGYDRLDGAIARFSWKDVGEAHETAKSLQFWIKDLTA